MADYNSKWTGQQIDEGIEKANNSVQGVVENGGLQLNNANEVEHINSVESGSVPTNSNNVVIGSETGTGDATTTVAEFSVPVIYYDGNGHITNETTSYTVTIPMASAIENGLMSKENFTKLETLKNYSLRAPGWVINSANNEASLGGISAYWLDGSVNKVDLRPYPLDTSKSAEPGRGYLKEGVTGFRVFMEAGPDGAGNILLSSWQWAYVAIENATTTAAGLMSAQDKADLENLKNGGGGGTNNPVVLTINATSSWSSAPSGAPGVYLCVIPTVTTSPQNGVAAYNKGAYPVVQLFDSNGYSVSTTIQNTGNNSITIYSNTKITLTVVLT